MKLLVKLTWDTLLAIEATNAGPLVECLQTAQLVKTVNQAGKTKYQPTAADENDEPGTLEVTFAPDSAFVAVPEPLLKIEEQRKQAESRWLEYYQKANALQKQVDELTTKLANITKATA